ncbi:hypothetical protein ACGF5M_00945 [Gemmatimonadota bacterium]
MHEDDRVEPGCRDQLMVFLISGSGALLTAGGIGLVIYAALHAPEYKDMFWFGALLAGLGVFVVTFGGLIARLLSRMLR